MPKDLIQRVNWDLIMPSFAELCFKLLANCRARGSDFFVISGYRSFPEQAKLYFQGRTAPGKIVTNARPGQSAHNYGLAIDCCLDENQERAGLQPNWKIENYVILQEEAEKLGLESGMSWKSFREGPHVQVKGVDLAHCKKLLESGKKGAVWSYVEKMHF